MTIQAREICRCVGTGRGQGRPRETVRADRVYQVAKTNPAVMMAAAESAERVMKVSIVTLELVSWVNANRAAKESNAAITVAVDPVGHVSMVHVMLPTNVSASPNVVPKRAVMMAVTDHVAVAVRVISAILLGPASRLMPVMRPVRRGTLIVERFAARTAEPATKATNASTTVANVTPAAPASNVGMMAVQVHVEAASTAVRVSTTYARAVCLNVMEKRVVMTPVAEHVESVRPAKSATRCINASLRPVAKSTLLQAVMTPW
jgi:hypothetical protein